MKVEMRIDPERCKGCGLCVSVCPLSILAMDKSYTNKKGYHPAANTAPEKCVGCANCAIMCPDAVITILKEA